MLVLGIVTGNIMAWIRKDQPSVPRYLSLAHEGCYQQGAMLLGLAVAAGFSTLSSGTEQLAAWLLVIAALLLFARTSTTGRPVSTTNSRPEGLVWDLDS